MGVGCGGGGEGGFKVARGAPDHVADHTGFTGEPFILPQSVGSGVGTLSPIGVGVVEYLIHRNGAKSGAKSKNQNKCQENREKSFHKKTSVILVFFIIAYPADLFKSYGRNTQKRANLRKKTENPWILGLDL